MSRFIREFDAILAERKIAHSGSRIFEIAGLDRSMHSRIRAGDKLQKNIQFKEIARIAAAIGPEDIIYLRLLAARLLDECHDPRASRIKIEIAGESKKLASNKNSSSSSLPELTPQVESAIRNIIARVGEPDIRRHITWFGNKICAPAPANTPKGRKPGKAVMPERDPKAVLEKATPPKTARAANG